MHSCVRTKVSAKAEPPGLPARALALSRTDAPRVRCGSGARSAPQMPTRRARPAWLRSRLFAQRAGAKTSAASTRANPRGSALGSFPIGASQSGLALPRKVSRTLAPVDLVCPLGRWRMHDCENPPAGTCPGALGRRARLILRGTAAGRLTQPAGSRPRFRYLPARVRKRPRATTS
jgi:hypothetical protein